MIELRRASASDVDAVARIYIDSWNRGFGELMGYRTNSRARRERWQEDLDDPAVIWTVAEIDGEVVGFSGVGPCRDHVDPEVGELQTIAVDPRSWRSGVGRALMAEALAHLRLSFVSAVLWTVTGYERGHAFYLAMGWTPLGWLRADGTETAFEHRLHERDEARPHSAPANSFGLPARESHPSPVPEVSSMGHPQCSRNAALH